MLEVSAKMPVALVALLAAAIGPDARATIIHLRVAIVGTIITAVPVAVIVALELIKIPVPYQPQPNRRNQKKKVRSGRR